MNIFMLGWSRSRLLDFGEAERTFRALVEQLPFFEGNGFEKWQAPSGRLAVVCAAHNPAYVGGVKYTHFEADRMAFFSGRPITWIDEFEADGRMPLDPRLYLKDPAGWSESLDGRYVAARYEDATGILDICTDPLGTYNVYTVEQDGVLWFSNNSELLRTLTTIRTVNLVVLASVAACGWPFGGQPLWAGVRRLERASWYRFSPVLPESRRDLLPARSVERLLNRGFDADSAAKKLLATVHALADWPDRPSYLGLTGGRDSRLVFAAALQSEIEFQPWIIVRNGEQTESPDARTARLLCESVGRQLRVESPQRDLGLEEVARILRLTERGTLQIDLAWGALTRPYQEWQGGILSKAPLPIVHTGLSGELARATADIGNTRSASIVASRLYHRTVQVWPRPLLSGEGDHLLRSYIEDWVQKYLDVGVALEHLPDLFFLEERTGNFNAPANGFDEYMLDITSPLRTAALLPFELGLPAAERARELFHFYLLQILTPDFTRQPFSESSPAWPTFGRNRPGRTHRAQTATRRTQREVARRYQHLLNRGRAMTAEEKLRAEGVRLALERADAYPGHDIWQVLSRKRTVALLRRDPRSLDVRSRRNVWRVATAFLTCVE
jgi:hypothetical protein